MDWVDMGVDVDGYGGDGEVYFPGRDRREQTKEPEPKRKKENRKQETRKKRKTES